MKDDSNVTPFPVSSEMIQNTVLGLLKDYAGTLPKSPPFDPQREERSGTNSS